MKKIISLVLSICMLTGIFANMNVFAQDNTNETMTAINDELSGYKKGDTITLSDDGYIGIPVDVSVYYDFERFGKAVPDYNKTAVVLYVVNTNTKRIGTASDSDIIKSMLDKGYAVAVADYKNNPLSVSPGLEYSVQLIRAKLKNGDFFADKNVFGEGTYIENHAVPAGYNITLGDVFFELDKHGLNGEIEKITEVWNYDFRGFWKDKSVKWVYEDGTRKATQNGFDGSTPVWYADAALTTVDNENGQYIKVGHTYAKSIFDLVKPDGTPIDFNLYIHIIYPTNPGYDVPVMTLASSSAHLASSYAMETRPHLLGYAFNGYAVAAFDHGYIPMAREDHYGHFDYPITGYSNVFRSDSREIYQFAAMRYLRYLSLNNHDTYSFDIEKFGVFGNSKGGFQTYLGDKLFVKEQYSSDKDNVSKDEIEKLIEKKLLDFGARKGLVALDPNDPVTEAEGEGTKIVFSSGTRYTNGVTASETKHGMTVDGGTVQPWLTYTENGVTKEIPSGVQMVYSSCGCMPEFMREGFSPMFSAGHVFDEFGGAFTEHNYVANKMRTENIPSLYFEMPLGHEFVYGKDMVYGVDAYDALFKFTDYYLKDTPVSVVYTDPKSGDGHAATTEDIKIKFYGPVSLDEIKKVTVANGDNIISGGWNNGYGDTEWTFTPDEPLKGNSTYVVTVPENLKGDNGKEMGEVYAYSFSTESEEYIVTKAVEGNVTSENALNVELEAPDLSAYGDEKVKLRFRVTNDAANIAEISENGNVIGSINLRGNGYYEYDITDYIKNKTQGEKLSFSIKAKKKAEDTVVYSHDFENLKQLGTNREGNPTLVTEVDGEKVTALKQTSGLHTWSKYGYTYFTPVRVTSNYFMNNGQPVTKDDYGRKFTITYRYKDTVSRNLELYQNMCSDVSTFTMDYDYQIKSQWTTPGVWEEISIEYSPYEIDYGVDSVVKTLTLEIPPKCDQDPFYIDKLTVTEHISDIAVDGVYLVAEKESDTLFEDKIPPEYRDKEEYPFVAFIGDKFVGAATHYCDKDTSDGNSVLDIAYARIVGESKKDTTLEVYLRRDYDVITANGDAWFGNYGQIGGHLVLNLGGHHLNAQIGLFNSTVKHGWDRTLRKSSLYDSYTTVKNGTISSKESVITHATQANGVDQYDHIRNSYFTFENVKFIPGSNCNANTIVASQGTATSEKHANLFVTLNNCEIDVTAVDKAVTLFNADDSADKYRANITMNGGRIVSDSIETITVAKVNESGTDSFTMGKYNDEYPELVISTGKPIGDKFNTTDDGELQFIKNSVTENATVYKLGIKPVHGEIPAEYQDVEKYPFAVFMDGEFIGAATHYSDTATADMNSVIDYAYANIRGESKANTTLNVLLRRDYTVSTANGDANNNVQGQLGGRLVIDLDGHKMDVQQSLFYVAVAHGWDGTLKKNSLYDAYAMVKNGSITISNNLIMYWLGSSIDSYENIKNSYYTFENVKFDVNTNTSRNVFVSANGASNTKNYGKLHVTFDNCEFDLKGRKDWFTLFNLYDANDKHHTTIKINGGRIVSNNLSGVTMVTLNESGTDSFIFGKYNDSYPELVLSLGSSAMTDVFKTENGGVGIYDEYSSDEENTVYRIIEKTKYGYIPIEYSDSEAYPFAIFIDGKFIAAATHYSDKDVNVVDSVIDVAYKNIVGETKSNVTLNVLLRRDYEISATNGDAYSGIQGLIGGHMVLDLDSHHLNAQMGMFNLGVRHGWDPTLKINSLYDAYVTVKNGTITVKDSNLGHTTIANGIDQYEKIRNTYVTYENIKFTTGEKCSGIPFVQSNTDAPSQNPANLYVTYTNCEFDMSNATNSMTFFNVNDGKDKYNGHIRVNGGRIIAKNMNLITIAALNESGNDSFVMGKYEGAYPELVIKSGAAPEAGFDTTDNGVSYFGKYEEVDGVTVYRLGKKSGSTVIPYDKISEITDYNGETFTATVKTAESGKYTLIFTQYDGDVLTKVDMVEYNFTKGETASVVQEDKSFKLTDGDAIMLWRDMTDCVPVCEAYIVR